MPIFKYTLKKYAKSTSTWVIVGISMFLVIVIGGYLPFSLLKPNKTDAIVTYGVISVALVAGITSFLAIFTSVFAGFKSATMYKDEVEDGTFLVMLSKPITRSKIIFFKWLALQTAIITYTFIVAASFAIALLAFDNGYKIEGLKAIGMETLRSKALMIALALWGILFVVSLIFSSVALLLSTKLSVGTTIGISIAIGVIIPVTSLVGTFTMKPEYASVTSSNAISLSAMADKLEVPADQKKLLEGEIKKLTDPAHTLYQLGISTGDKDSFQFAQVFDLNYQIQTLSEFASDQAIPDNAKEMLANSNAARGSMKISKNKLIGDGIFPTPEAEQVAKLNDLITNSWKVTQSFRSLLIPTIIAKVIPDTKIAADADHILNASIDGQTIAITDQTTAATYLLNAAKPVETVTDSEQYRKDVSIARQILEALDSDDKLLSKPTSTQKAMIEYGMKLLKPLSFWVSSSNLQKVMADVSLDSNFDSATNTQSLGMLKDVVVKEDKEEYKMLVSAIHNGNNLVKIKTVDYTNKYTLLWIYLAFALALVPVSYLVVRKQDFR